MSFKRSSTQINQQDELNKILNESSFSKLNLDQKDIEDEVNKMLIEGENLYDPGMDQALLNQNINQIIFENESYREEKAVKKFPEFRSNIEFVQYFEKEYIKTTLESFKCKDKVYTLKSYKGANKKNKLPVLNIMEKKILSERLYKLSNTKLVTCITAFGDWIFAGNTVGIIKMYTIEKQIELKSYTAKEVEGSNSVICIDVCPDGSHIVSGYKNGTIVLWEKDTAKPKKIKRNS